MTFPSAGLRAGCCILFMAGLPGCGSMPTMRRNIDAFGAGVRATADAQRSLYASGRKLECDADFYSAAVDWAGQSAAKLPDLGGCAPTVMDDARLAKRQALLDALTLYADKLEALAGPKGDNSLGDAENDLAANLNALAKTAKLGLDTSAAGAVEAAVIAISNLALDQIRFHDARKAAQQLDSQIALIVDTLKIENHDYGASLKSATARMQVSMNAALALEKARGAQSFLEASQARTILTKASAFGPVGAADLASEKDLPTIARLNAALDGVRQANHEIATAPDETVTIAIQDLIARAKQAKADQAALSK